MPCSFHPQVALPAGRVCGKCPHAARRHHGNRIWVRDGQCRRCGCVPGPQLEHAETCSNAEATRRHYAWVHAVVCGMKLADPGITTEPRGLTASQSRPADILTTATVSGRSAALDVCVASSVAAAARGDAAQAAFDPKLTLYRNELGELRQQKIHYRPLVWTGDGRPHPAVTRTLQYAADIASSCNGQHLSAKSLHHRWKHEIQFALPRRRAAMARAILPNPSARARRHHGQSPAPLGTCPRS